MNVERNCLLKERINNICDQVPFLNLTVSALQRNILDLELLFNLGDNNGANFRIGDILRIINDYKGQGGIEGNQWKEKASSSSKTRKVLFTSALNAPQFQFVKHKWRNKKNGINHGRRTTSIQQRNRCATHHRDKFTSRYRSGICPILCIC